MVKTCFCEALVFNIVFLNLTEEGNEGGIKKTKVEDEDILKCFGCKHVYRTLTEIRAHLAAYEKCSTSTWVCDFFFFLYIFCIF